MKVHVEDGINAYFEGRLSVAAERDALFGHLDRCEDCRDHFDAIADADRMLADADVLPKWQFDVVREAVLNAAVEPKATLSLSPRWWANWLVPAAVAAAALFMAYPTSEWRSKGGTVDPVRPTIEVLCFDDDAKIVAHLEASGACPAPGFLKVIYASAASVPHLTVAVRQNGTVQFVSALEDPKPRSVVPAHTVLAEGDVVEIIVLTDPPPHDPEMLVRAEPTMVVRGTKR